MSMDLFQWLEAIALLVGILAGITAILDFALKRRSRSSGQFTPFWSLVPEERRPSAELAILAELRTVALQMIGLGYLSGGVFFAAAIYLAGIGGDASSFLYGTAAVVAVTGSIEIVISRPFGRLTFRSESKRST